MIIVDTGVLYALADKRDAHHGSCLDWLAEAPRPLMVSPLVVAEACYLINRYCGPSVEAAFLDSLCPGQTFRVVSLVDADFVRMADLVRQYSDLPLGGTDASVIAVAERLKTIDVATIDHRHFTVVQPRHAPAFHLLP